MYPTTPTERLMSNVYRERMVFNDEIFAMQKSLNELLHKYNRVSGALEDLLVIINKPTETPKERRLKLRALEQYIETEVNNTL